MSTMMPFASSFGAPVLVLPIEIAESWSGEEPALPNDRVATEWGDVGWLETGGGRALVLGSELFTRFVPTERGGVIVRNGSAKTTRAAVDALVSAVPAAAWKPLRFTFELREGRAVIFDSAQAGASDPRKIHGRNGVVVADVGPGTYALALAEHDGCDLIRLDRASRVVRSRETQRKGERSNPASMPAPAKKTKQTTKKKTKR